MKNFLRFILFCIFVTYLSRFTAEAIYILTTDPPFQYMVVNLAEQTKCAKKAGFIHIKKPSVRVMRGRYVSTNSYGNTYYPDGYALLPFNMIILANYASYVTMAHEMGHIIDYQTKRRGHPLFIGNENLDDQIMADLIGHAILKACGQAIQ